MTLCFRNSPGCGCEPDPCPEERTCDGEYPTRVSSFRFTAAGIENLWTGAYSRNDCKGFTSNLATTCCEKTTFVESISWSLTGFSALNGVHDHYVSAGTDPCDDVCDQCTLSLPTRYVKITGTMTYSWNITTTRSGTGSCLTEVDSGSGTQDLCGFATINVNTFAKTARVFIPLLTHVTASGDDPRRRWILSGFFNGINRVEHPLCDASAMPSMSSGCTLGQYFEIVPGITGDFLPIDNPWGAALDPSDPSFCGESCDDADTGGRNQNIYSSSSHICDDATFDNDYTTQGLAACDDAELSAGLTPGCDPGVTHTDCDDGFGNNDLIDRTLEYDAFGQSWTLNELLAN